jgi:hypothetical protein
MPLSAVLARPLVFLGGSSSHIKVCIDTCQPEMLELLLEHGADPQQRVPTDVNARGSFGRTALSALLLNVKSE